MDSNAKLKIGNKEFNFPIKKGSVGPSVIDVSKLYAETHHFTFDPGFTSTGSCESSITYMVTRVNVITEDIQWIYSLKKVIF